VDYCGVVGQRTVNKAGVWAPTIQPVRVEILT